MVVFFIYIHIVKKLLKANSGEPDQTSRFKSHKKDAKLICVNGELIQSHVYNFEQYNSSYIFNSHLEPNK